MAIEFEMDESISQIDYESTTLKDNFTELNSEVHKLYQEQVSLERDYQQSSVITRFFSHLGLGTGRTIKKNISSIKKVLDQKNTQISIIREQILKLTSERKRFEQAIQINGKKIILTSYGEMIIDEIKARKRYFPRDLRDLINLINQLDELFSNLIKQVGDIMKNNVFSPLWAVLLLNTDKMELVRPFNTITNTEMYYNNAEKRMMKLFIHTLKEPRLISPKGMIVTPSTSLHVIRQIEKQMHGEYRINNPKYKIRDIVDRYIRISRFRAQLETELIGKLFSTWNFNHENSEESEQYVENLKLILSDETRSRIIDSDSKLMKHLKNIRDQEMAYATLVLPLVSDFSHYEYFYNMMEDIPEVAKFFSAVASLFPWDPEETWIVLLRAQSNILRAQSAKFIPELIEYAILLSLHPAVIDLENSIPEEWFDKWINLIIPLVHVLTYSYLEKDLVRYIRRRPLAYVISPRFYVRSALHYHVLG